MTRTLPLLLLAPLLAAGCQQVPRDWVAAERATHDAIADNHRTYVENDPALELDEKQREIRTLDTWKMRIEAHEKAIAAGSGQ